ncbi:MAG: hypothetical protein ACNA8W_13995 [Bradymonadaceae bacterium]
MGIIETTIIYGIVGAVLAAGLAIASPGTPLAARFGLFFVHSALWPFFAPTLLGRATQGPQSEPGHSPPEHDSSALDPRIHAAEARLITALSSLDGIAEEVLAPQMESVRNLSRSLARMDTRQAEMDELLTSPEFDRDEAENALRALLDNPQITPDDSRIESIEARLRNIERLHTMRERAQRDIERAILKMEEMNSQILLFRFADKPENEMAELIGDISATVDGLSEGLFTM